MRLIVTIPMLQMISLSLLLSFLVVTKNYSSEQILSQKYVLATVRLFATCFLAVVPGGILIEKANSLCDIISLIAFYIVGFIIEIAIFILRKRIWRTFLP